MVTTSTARVLMAIWFTIFAAVGVLTTTIAVFAVKPEFQNYAWFGMVPSGIFMILSLCCIFNCIDFPGCLVQRCHLTYNGEDGITSSGFDYDALVPADYPHPEIPRLHKIAHELETSNGNRIQSFPNCGDPTNGYKISSDDCNSEKSMNKSHSSAFCVIKSPEEIRTEGSHCRKLYPAECEAMQSTTENSHFNLSGSGSTSKTTIGYYEETARLIRGEKDNFDSREILAQIQRYGTMQSPPSSVEDGFSTRSRRTKKGPNLNSLENFSLIAPIEKCEKSDISAEILLIGSSSEDVSSECSPKSVSATVHRNQSKLDVKKDDANVLYQENSKYDLSSANGQSPKAV